MKTILLKLAGPLQSWGTSSHFETRHTDYYPSKSGVIGLIAASLGYKREQEEEIRRLNELDFAVRVEQQGNLLRDYHIAQVQSKKHEMVGNYGRNPERTYVTNRYYLEDAVFVVAISHEDDTFMDQILQALKNPYFQPFLGKKSLPLVADFILNVSEKGALDSLKDLDWQASDWYMKKNAKTKNLQLEIYVDSYLSEKKAYQLRKDVVKSFSKENRRFGFRYEVCEFTTVQNPYYVDKTDSNTKHDIFEAVGG